MKLNVYHSPGKFPKIFYLMFQIDPYFPRFFPANKIKKETIKSPLTTLIVHYFIMSIDFALIFLLL